MQVEAKKPCGACAAENAPQATYCWRCFAAFAPAMPPAPGNGTRAAGRMPPAPSQAWGALAPIVGTQAPPKRRQRFRTAIGLAAGLAVSAGVLGFLDKGPSLPDAVAGRSRLESVEASRFQEQMQQEADQWDLHVQAGMYGTADAPSMFVILVDGAAIETTDQLYESFVSGMEGSGALVDRAAIAQGERDGTEYRCVPIQGQLDAVACMWRDDDNVGIVLGIDETTESGVDLLFATHDAALD